VKVHAVFFAAALGKRAIIVAGKTGNLKHGNLSTWKERTVIYQTESTESTPVSLALVGRMVPSQEWDFQ
jgi:hypothetical protein